MILIYVQFNKLIYYFSIERYGRPKDNYWLKQLEFGISRNIFLLGKRKIHSTFILEIIRKESSYTIFMRYILKGTKFHKSLLVLNTQLNLLGCSNNLTVILSSLDYLNLLWVLFKLDNKDLFFSQNKSCINYQYKIWSYNTSKKFKLSTLNFYCLFFDRLYFGLSSYNQKSYNFGFGDLIIQKSISILLLFVFERFISQLLNYDFFEFYKKIQNAKDYFKFFKWFISGHLVFDTGRFMNIVSKRVVEQSFKDLLYKYLNSSYFISSLTKECFVLYENKILSSIILNVYFNSFDYWIEHSLIPRYLNSSVFILKRDNVKIVYIRYLSEFVIGILGSRNISVEVLNRVEEKFFEMTFLINSKFILTYKHTIFMGYSIIIPSSNKVQILVSMNEIIVLLKSMGFLSSKGAPTRNCRFLNYKLSEIIRIYRRVELDILRKYHFSDNFDYISSRVFYFLRYSCALTFCSKMKLKTLKKTFKKYGYYLNVKEDRTQLSFRRINYKQTIKL